jgi:tRNA(Ile)-lysidine synthase
MAAAGGLTPGWPEHWVGFLPFAVARRLPPGPVLVALGGGADSALCAWAVVRARRPVRAATVDHGLPASPVLIATAQALAAHLGIEHRLLPARARGHSEGALRAARYAALEAEAAPGEIIVTGHTADDHAETVLGNLLRGAGAGGLAGIPERRGRWHRPLLDLSRAEVRAAADFLGLPYTDDPGNADLSRRRNVLRHEVLPLLEERLGPGVRAALRRAASLLSADDAALEGRAAAVPLRVAPGRVLLPAAALSTLPPPVASRVVRRALRLVLDPYPGHRRDVEAVMQAATAAGPAARPFARPLQAGFLAVREGPWVVLRPAAALPPPLAATLPVPGEAAWEGWVVRAEGPMPSPALLPVGRREARIDPAAASAGLVVRGAAAGDRIATGTGRKPVAEALREAGVPAPRREGWPVVVSGGRIAWVAGARLAAWAAPRGPVVVRLSLREAV